SRSDSVQAASASRRRIAARSSAAPPDSPRQANTSSTVPAATTGQPVTARTTTAAIAATAVRVVSAWIRWRLGREGRGRTPYRERISRNRPPPMTAPGIRASGSRPGMSPAPRVVAVGHELLQAGHRRVRHGGTVRAGHEDLAGQHAAVAAVDLADAGDEPAQVAAPVVVVALLDEDDEVDGARDEHVGGVDGQPLARLERVGGDAVEDLHAGV